MVDACTQAGVPLFVAYYRRALPRFELVKRLLDEGVIGDVRYVTSTQLQKAKGANTEGELPWRVRPEIAGAGLFLDLASHTLDILDHLLGPIRDVNGLASNRAGLYSAEDIVSGSYIFESGVHGIGLWGFCAQERQDMNEIVGSKGKLSFATFGEGPIVLRTEAETKEFPVDNPKHIQQPLIQTIVNELLGEGKCPSTGVTASRTSRVMDAMVANYYR
jgi:predicted dehydrogenase